MEKYEKNIGLKTVWLTIIRRFLVIFAVFLPIALATVVYTQFFITKTYQSSVSYYRSGGITSAQYPIIPSTIKSSETAQTVADNLKSADPVIKHSNGSEITASEILNGLSITSSISSTTGTVSFTFQSSDKAICKVVLEEVANVALPTINATLSGTTISSHASEPTKNSKENTYLLIGLGAGLVLALGFAFVYEIISDEVYDKSDIESLGCGGFDFTASK